ncbi:hypothetical protein ES703_80100 [subsurface metagenome]
MKRIILFVVPFLSLALLLLPISGCVGEDGSSALTVELTLSIDYGPAQGEEGIDEFYELEMTGDSTLWDAINEVAEVEATDYGELGHFIDAINGVGSDVTVSDCYWIWYHINGEEEQGATGASGYELEQGDHILWRYEIHE